MGSDPQSHLEQQYAPIRRLREALVNRQVSAHTYGIMWARDINRIPSHREPIETCPSPGCVEARAALEGSKGL